MEYSKDQLARIISEHALQFGDFTLASGKKATYYLDCRKITLLPDGINQIALGMLDRLKHRPSIDCIGGMAIGADPITAGIVTHAGLNHMPLRGFMVRKEAKQHGTGKLVEGPVTPGMKAVIVEDVITSGGSALQAVKAVREFGIEVVGVLAIIDRLEGGRKNFEAEGISLETLFTIEDFGIKPPASSS
jgi:orotate phosphoribosyltransferase